LIRHILETTRGEDPEASAIKQIVWAIQAKIQQNVAEVQQQIADLLERGVVDTWRTDTPPAEGHPPDPERPRPVAAGPLPHEVEHLAPEPGELHGTTRRRRGARGGRR
jgi:hypothetical protein